MIKICLANIKGGVGKTTTAFNIAGILAEAGYRVLCIDVDPQGNFSDNFFGDDYGPGINELIKGDSSLPEVLRQPYPDHDYLRNIWVITADVELFYITDSCPEFEKEYVFKLKQLLGEIEDNFDFCILDTNPSPSLLTNSMAYCYADYIIGVLDISKHSIKGFEYLRSIIDDIKKLVNPDLELLGIVINGADRRTNFSSDVIKSINELYKDLVFPVIINIAVKVKESSVATVPVSVYDPNGMPRIQYAELISNILKRIDLRRRDHAKNQRISG